jgi:hypothetical protein
VFVRWVLLLAVGRICLVELKKKCCRSLNDNENEVRSLVYLLLHGLGGWIYDNLCMSVILTFTEAKQSFINFTVRHFIWENKSRTQLLLGWLSFAVQF